MEPLFEKIIKQHQSKTAVIIEILRARGFLIDQINAKFFLSDNAALDDIAYLSEGLMHYSIGRVVERKSHIKKRRRCWNGGGSYEYESFLFGAAEIMIDNSASVDDAIRFFDSSGRIGVESGGWGRSWAEFCTEMLGIKPSVRELEPFISFYVKAISSCGVYTCFSCDGKHKGGGKVYVYSDYPSNIWHECIWKHVVQPHFGIISYIEDGIVFSPKNQGETYLKLYDIADYLYKNRWKIREVKQYAVDKIDKKYRHTHSIEQIEEYFRDRCQLGFERVQFVG